MSETQDELQRKKESAYRKYQDYKKKHEANKEKIGRLNDASNYLDDEEDHVCKYANDAPKNICEGMIWKGHARNQFNEAMNQLCLEIKKTAYNGGVIDQAQDRIIQARNDIQKLSSDGALRKLYNAYLDLSTSVEQFIF